MTTLYRPVLIETAEQAEALPVGTLIAWEHCDLPGVPMVAIKYSNDEVAQIGTHLTDVIAGFVSTGGVLFTALVPIEAEEERARSQINITHLPPPVPQMVPVRLPCLRCGLR